MAIERCSFQIKYQQMHERINVFTIFSDNGKKLGFSLFSRTVKINIFQEYN